MEISAAIKMTAEIKACLQKVVVGKDEVIEAVLASIIANGHVLLEDVPGTGKTLLAKTLAQAIGGDYKRIQFTPDLMPSDVTGINIFNQKEMAFEFKQGPVFADILLADEINRATPRSQAALLECMEERQITVDGVTYKLPIPFLVIATQNPVETAGTFPLPEAQLDRFLVKLSMGYPTAQEGMEIINRFEKGSPLAATKAVATSADIDALQQCALGVHIADCIKEYIVAIAEATRKTDKIMLGVSPRGILAFVRLLRGYAIVKGRDHALPDDVKTLAHKVLGHRIITQSLYGVSSNSEAILAEIMQNVPAPTEEIK